MESSIMAKTLSFILSLLTSSVYLKNKKTQQMNVACAHHLMPTTTVEIKIA